MGSIGEVGYAATGRMDGLSNGIGGPFGRPALLAFAVLLGASCEREVGDSAYGDAAHLIPALEPGSVYVLGRCSFRVVDEDIEHDVKLGSRCATPGRDR